MNAYRSARGRAITIVSLVALQLALDFVPFFLPPELFDAGEVLGAAGSVLYLITFIVALSWVYRAVANLGPLGAVNIYCRPLDAVLGLLTPMVNIVESRRVFENLWLDSDNRPRSSSPVTAWWLLSLVETAFEIAETQTSAHWVEGAQIALHFLAGVSFMRIVWLSQVRQDARFAEIAAPAS